MNFRYRRRANAFAAAVTIIFWTFAPIFRGAAQDAPAEGIDLLKRYPTTLTAGDTAPEHARPWQFSASDVFHLSQVSIEAADNLKIHAGSAELGLGHCRDGVVWALVIPSEDSKLTSTASSSEEPISHVWLRFHPSLLAKYFPSRTVSETKQTNLFATMRWIAAQKFRSVYNVGSNAVIPHPGDMIVDVDIQDGPRRVFIIDHSSREAAYTSAFETQKFQPPPEITPALAESCFDQLWEVFDSGYAMFTLRPEVDWAKSRERFRPLAVGASSSEDFAAICADMLRPLHDLHVSLKMAGTFVPVFEQTQEANSNPSAHKTILGSLNRSGRLQWAVTQDKIGFLDIYGWDDEGLADQFDKALDQMRDTRGLILDVRWCGGGTETLAQRVAGRFITKETVYAYHQFRDGPKHNDFTEKYARKVQPRGPWRYEHPVILLMGQKCMSTTESFIGMMVGVPNLTTMGDRTSGSSGDPQPFQLPLEITVNVPRRLDFKPDGKPLDAGGFQPQVPFKPGPGAFGKNRDDLLSAALSRLRKSP
jgi:hypothetical protein